MITLPEHIRHVVTDSRAITPGHIKAGDTAFVALKTAVGDGHRFVRSLYEGGLRNFVVDCPEQFADLADAQFIHAPQGTLQFLIDSAGQRLSAHSAKQIVITGSSLKTTTKELIVEGLRAQGYTVARSPRTWNSAMGTALSIIENTSGDADYIVTEVGIDAPGQAGRLAQVLRPDIAVLTRIDTQHDEAFPSHAAKVAEKIALIKDARLIVDASGSAEAARQLKNVPGTVITVGHTEAAVYAATGARVHMHAVSTRTEVRNIPQDGILITDKYTNDLESLPLSLDMACRRLAGRALTVVLTDFQGDKDAAAELVEERGGRVIFRSTGDAMPSSRSDFASRLILLRGNDPELETYLDEARHDTTMRIDLEAIVHNYNVFRHAVTPDTGLIAMVKADAYGMGALEVAKTLQASGAAYLAVAVVDEGVALRQAGITMPVIVLNPITNRFEALVANKLEPAVFSLDELEHLTRGIEPYTAAPLPIHIKLDTGMHRVGFVENDIPRLAEKLNASRLLRPSTIFSHLATADCPDMAQYTEMQLQDFRRMSRALATKLSVPVRRHLLNTAGTALLGQTPHAYDLCRIGIGLYGISPLAGNTLGLRNVATLTSTIVSVKHWPAGTSIGYGGKALTTGPSVIATVPIGYADGIDRRLGNGRAVFYVRGHACPTIGNVCMDQLMIDITGVPGAGVGDEVEIFGPQQSPCVLADILGTIPYEIPVRISPRVRRTYLQ